MTENTPLVSIIIATYNRARFIEETVESILKQTFGDFELIIISDGSTDNTTSIIASIDDQRIRYVEQPPSGRPAVPRNRGIQLSRGKYVAFCDDDDLWGAEKLAKQVAFMEQHPDIGLSFGYAENFGETAFKGMLLYARKESDSIVSFEKLLLGNKIATFTVLVRKRCLDAVGCFDENPEFKAIEDYDLWLRIALKYKIACVPEILGKYRVHPENISGNKVKERMKLLKIAEKFKKDGLVAQDLLKKVESRIFWMIGNAMLGYNDSQYRKWLVNSFIAAKNMRTTLALLLCCLPIGVSRRLYNYLEKLKVNCQH